MFWLLRVKCQSVFHRYHLSCISVLFHHLHSCWGQRTKPVLFSQEKHPFHLNYWHEWMIDLCLLCQQWFPPPPFPPLKTFYTLADIWAFNLNHSSKIESHWRNTFQNFWWTLASLVNAFTKNIKVEAFWLLFYQENIRRKKLSKSF